MFAKGRFWLQKVNQKGCETWDTTFTSPPPRWCTHQTTFFNYVIGIFILIVLSRLANLHGLMRGMFPLQVISYLRGGGVVERLNREEDACRRGCRKTKALKNNDVWCQFFFFFLFLQRAVKQTSPPPKKIVARQHRHLLKRQNQEKIRQLLNVFSATHW